ncbi:MAG: GntR family transcriptional regulator [Raoultibacter sp.]
MIIRLEQSSKQPLYLQIREQVIAAIATGELAVGEALPSVRSLACDLSINLHTVNKAYAVLRDEGYLLMRGRSGAFVADPESHTMQGRGAVEDARMAQELYALALAHRARGGSEVEFKDAAAQQAARAFSE